MPRAASIFRWKTFAGFGVTEDDIAAQRNTAAFCEMMRFEVERARDWFRRGLPLVEKVDRELAA